jgi:hypothetical protein
LDWHNFTSQFTTLIPRFFFLCHSFFFFLFCLVFYSLFFIFFLLWYQCYKIYISFMLWYQCYKIYISFMLWFWWFKCSHKDCLVFLFFFLHIFFIDVNVSRVIFLSCCDFDESNVHNIKIVSSSLLYKKSSFLL